MIQINDFVLSAFFSTTLQTYLCCYQSSDFTIHFEKIKIFYEYGPIYRRPKMPESMVKNLLKNAMMKINKCNIANCLSLFFFSFSSVENTIKNSAIRKTVINDDASWQRSYVVELFRKLTNTIY